MAPPTSFRVEVLVCEGRVCTGNGAAIVSASVVASVAAAADATRAVEGAPEVRVRRGGCYGLCDLGPNVVVRRNPADAVVDDDADRLNLRGGPDEDVCVAVAERDVTELLHGVASEGRAPAHLLRAAREAALAPRSPVEARLRALRARRGTTKGAVVVGAAPGGVDADVEQDA